MPVIAALEECEEVDGAASEALLPAAQAAIKALLSPPFEQAGREWLEPTLEAWPEGTAREAVRAALSRGVGSRGTD